MEFELIINFLLKLFVTFYLKKNYVSKCILKNYLRGIFMLSISKVLEFAGLDLSKRTKIARHRDTRGVDVHELYTAEHFELYQSYQEKIILKIVTILSPV